MRRYFSSCPSTFGTCPISPWNFFCIEWNLKATGRLLRGADLRSFHGRGGSDISERTDRKELSVEDVYPLIMPDNCVVFFPFPIRRRKPPCCADPTKEIGRIIGDVSRGETRGRRSGAWKGLASKVGGAAYRKMKKTQKFWVKGFLLRLRPVPDHMSAICYRHGRRLACLDEGSVPGVWAASIAVRQRRFNLERGRKNEIVISIRYGSRTTEKEELWEEGIQKGAARRKFGESSAKCSFEKLKTPGYRQNGQRVRCRRTTDGSYATCYITVLTASKDEEEKQREEQQVLEGLQSAKG